MHHQFTVKAPPIYVQVPKFFWHPVPQYAAVVPHQPAELQQLPKVEPWQVKPLVPPQVASVVTFLVAVGAAEVDVRVELEAGRVELEAGRVELETGRVELPAGGAELWPVPVQVPKAAWHPVPQ